MFIVDESSRERLTNTWKCETEECQVLGKVLQRSDGRAEESHCTLLPFLC